MRALVLRAGLYLWHSIICLAVLAGVLVAFWAFSLAKSIEHRREAERLLSELQSLPTGADGYARAEQLANKFDGVKHCTSDSCSYDFEKSFGFTKSGLAAMLRRTEWDSVRLRPWKVSARIATAHNEVTAIGVMALVGRGRGWLYNQGLLSGDMWSWLAVSVAVNSERFDTHVKFAKERASESAGKTGHQTEPGKDGIFVGKPAFDISGGGHLLDVYVSPVAISASRAAAFNINLRCATAALPCTELCQLAPSAWQSYSRYQRSNGWWVEDTSCVIP